VLRPHLFLLNYLLIISLLPFLPDVNEFLLPSLLLFVLFVVSLFGVFRGLIVLILDILDHLLNRIVLLL
jgi:hypothetical protein